MKKNYLLAIATVAVMAGCSSNDLVNETPDRRVTETPIGFSVQKQNITRADANLETIGHYNFGVWAWKEDGKNDLGDAEVMNNYLVGYSNGTDTGYDNSKATTYASSAGTDADHKSPWFYESLGSAEYTYNGDAGFYKASQTDYMSNNANQYLRFWDLAYTYTRFYCYAPYNKAVTFNRETKTMTFPATAIRDGYDHPVNTAYAGRSLSEYMYAGSKLATNAEKKDIQVTFKHMGAQVYICFYEDLPGYKVELIDLGGDKGNFVTGTDITADMKLGIQAAPAKKTGTGYEKAKYYTTHAATITYVNDEFTPIWDGATEVGTPLMFQLPTQGLTDFNGLGTTVHKTLPEKVTSGTQNYGYSPTVYYPVAQPEASTTGFTFHVSYRIIAEDNKEVITVHNATVHVPCNDGAANPMPITAWQPNKKYTYIFKIIKGSSGSTDPDVLIDPTNPVPSDDNALFPIVFDQVTIKDYEDVTPNEYVINQQPES